MYRTRSLVAAIALASVLSASTVSADQLLTSINIDQWPATGTFSFAIGGQAFTHPWQTGLFDIFPVPDGLKALMTDGIPETVRISVGDAFIERPESFFTSPADGHATCDGSVCREQTPNFPGYGGLDWHGFLLNSFTIHFVESANPQQGITTGIDINGRAPEPTSALLALASVAGLFVFRRSHRRAAIQ
jgi:hypothetical protein